MVDDPTDAGVVDQNIQTPPYGQGLLHQPHPLRIVSQVGLYVNCRAQFKRQGPTRLHGSSRVQDQGITFSGESTRDRLSYA